MNKRDLIQKIIHSPKLHREQKGLFYDFLKKIGYFEFYDQITEKDIEGSLTEHPGLIQLWLDYSDNQNQSGSSAWHFTKSPQNTYEVGFYNGDKVEPLYKFTNANKACAFYVGTVLEPMKGDYLLDKIGLPEVVDVFRKEKIINEIAYMPKRLDDLRHVSSCEFLKRVGYFKFHDRINEDTIEGFLTKNLECIELWLQYSDDQRCIPVWIIKALKNTYEVVLYTEEGVDETHSFTDLNKACAFYVKKELEAIRKACN